MATQKIQTATAKQVKLLEVIREICTELNIPFGHGMRSYANTEDRQDLRTGIYDNEKMFPRGYLSPYLVNDSINTFGQLECSYECAMDFLTECKLSDNQLTLEERMYEMFMLSAKFVFLLAKHKAVVPKEFKNIERKPNYHVYDANLCGFELTFTIKLREDLQLC